MQHQNMPPRTVRGVWRRLALSAIVALGLVVASLPLWAQNAGPVPGAFLQDKKKPALDPDEETVEDAAIDGVFFPPDHKIVQQLRNAKEAIGEQRYGDACEILHENLLRLPEDYFYRPESGEKTYHSIKAEAQRLIGEMPKEGRESYELQFGAAARKLLADAAAAGDFAVLAEVGRRYFHTKAGYEATLILARNHLDHGRPLAAALALKRLQESAGGERFEPELSILLASAWSRAGQAERAKSTAIKLAADRRGEKLKLGSRQVELFRRDEDALKWLADAVGPAPKVDQRAADQWLMFGGNAARNASSRGDLPLMNSKYSWKVRVGEQPEAEKQANERRTQAANRNQPMLPPYHPLAVGDVVLMRTPKKASSRFQASGKAIDFASGKIVWPLNQSTEAISASEPAPAAARGFMAETYEYGNEDIPYGTLSSDGQQVYLIEAAPRQTGSRGRTVINPNGQRELPPPVGSSNVLVALDLAKQGKRAWQIGGEYPEDARLAPRLDGAFFLGPPLPMHGKLYQLAELRGEVLLAVLDAKTGKLDWSQQLAVLEQHTYLDNYRRSVGVTPSYADGVLVCPTTAGAVVGVDLTNRSLLWGFPFAHNNDETPIRHNPFARVNIRDPSSDDEERWVDSSAIIADGRVLVTPAESDELFCLSLLDGKLLWKAPRGDALYLAGVYRDRAIVVRPKQVQLLNAATGREDWKTELALPGETLPSGRGFLSGQHYFLPLSSAEVLKIDVEAVAVRNRVKSRAGIVPGNLICFKDQIVSQGSEFLETFYQLEPLKAQISEALAKNPSDAWALARRGELLLDDGQVDEALAVLRRSYESEPAPDTRELLVESLLSSLLADFAKHESAVPELERLIEFESEQAALQRVLVEGRRSKKDVSGSLAALGKLIDLKWNNAQLERVDVQWEVRRGRWIEAQLLALSEIASPQQRSEIDRLVADRLEAALVTKGFDSLKNFVSQFGHHPAAEAGREQLSVRLPAARRVERELLLLPLLSSQQSKLRGAATARLAMLLRDADVNDEAARLYRILRDEFADERVLDDMTGKQLVAALPSDHPVRKVLDPSPATWPVGEVKAASSPPAARGIRNSQRIAAIEFRGDRGAFFDGVTLSYASESQHAIIGRDAFGKDRFYVPLGDPTDRQRILKTIEGASSPIQRYARTYGPFLFVCTGSQIHALDPFAPRSGGKRLLWSRDLAEFSPYSSGEMQPRMITTPLGINRAMVEMGGQPIGSLGPVTRHGVCWQEGRNVHCSDLFTGEIVWTRHNQPLGCELFGDDEALVIAPPEGGEALVVRAADGGLIAGRTIPAPEQRLAMPGRRILTWSAAGGKIRLVLKDPKTDATQWTSTAIMPGSRSALLDSQAVGVHQPDGRFLLIALKDGRTLIDKQLEPARGLTSLHLMADADRIFAVAASSGPPKGKVVIGSVFSDALNPLVTGQVYAFDRATGEPLWSCAATVEKHGLLLNAPPGLPGLVFMRQTREAGEKPPVKTSVLVLDKRDGRAVFQKADFKPSQQNTELWADPQASTLTLGPLGESVTLKFTDNPTPPEPPYQIGSTAGSPADRLGRSPVGILFRAIGAGAKSLTPNEFNDDPFGMEDEDVFEEVER